jgi:hypothetical protein
MEQVWIGAIVLLFLLILYLLARPSTEGFQSGYRVNKDILCPYLRDASASQQQMITAMNQAASGPRPMGATGPVINMSGQVEEIKKFFDQSIQVLQC